MRHSDRSISRPHAAAIKSEAQRISAICDSDAVLSVTERSESLFELLQCRATNEAAGKQRTPEDLREFPLELFVRGD